MTYARSCEQAGLDVFLTRLVVSHGWEDRKVFTTGPLIPLEPGDEQAQVSCAGIDMKACLWDPPVREEYVARLVRHPPVLHRPQKK